MRCQTSAALSRIITISLYSTCRLVNRGPSWVTLRPYPFMSPPSLTWALPPPATIRPQKVAHFHQNPTRPTQRGGLSSALLTTPCSLLVVHDSLRSFVLSHTGLGTSPNSSHHGACRDRHCEPVCLDRHVNFPDTLFFFLARFRPHEAPTFILSCNLGKQLFLQRCHPHRVAQPTHTRSASALVAVFETQLQNLPFYHSCNLSQPFLSHRQPFVLTDKSWCARRKPVGSKSTV